MQRWERLPFWLLVAVFFYTCRPCCTFPVRRLLQTAPSSPTSRQHRLHESSSYLPRDDPVRSSNRASLHPLTINILSDLLQLRARGDSPPFVTAKNATTINSSTVTPLELAIGVSRMAVEKLRTRQELSNVDGMSLTPEEQQTVAGRVVGVTMRLSMLEADLEPNGRPNTTNGNDSASSVVSAAVTAKGKTQQQRRRQSPPRNFYWWMDCSD
jgi:hypothetical protein